MTRHFSLGASRSPFGAPAGCRGGRVLARDGRFVNYVQGDAVNGLIRAFYAQLSVPEASLDATVSD